MNGELELTLFLWHMPDVATEGVAEHSSRLQPSINLHAPVTAFMFSCSGYKIGNEQINCERSWVSETATICVQD